jgi:hypothetical protein
MTILEVSSRFFDRCFLFDIQSQKSFNHKNHSSDRNTNIEQEYQMSILEVSSRFLDRCFLFDIQSQKSFNHKNHSLDRMGELFVVLFPK